MCPNKTWQKLYASRFLFLYYYEFISFFFDWSRVWRKMKWTFPRYLHLRVRQISTNQKHLFQRNCSKKWKIILLPSKFSVDLKSAISTVYCNSNFYEQLQQFRVSARQRIWICNFERCDSWCRVTEVGSKNVQLYIMSQFHFIFWTSMPTASISKFS